MRGRRPGSASRANSRQATFNETGLSVLGQQMRRLSRDHRKARRRQHRVRRILLGVTTVIVLVAAGTFGYGWYLNHQIHRIKVNGLSASLVSGADANTENILLVGSTTRCGLTQQNAAYGLCSQGVTGVNSDVVMILHLDPATRSVSILSIPRDLFIPNARTTGANKIDAALYQGPSQLVAAIQEDFGIPIQHYVELNFDTFANVVNALGGINMYFPQPVYDAYSGLNVPTPGCIHLDGLHALQVVRARHLQYKGPGVTSTDPTEWPSENQSDLARIRRDHEFLRVLATAVAKNGLTNPITDFHLVSGVAPQLSVDQQFSQSNMVGLITTFHSVNVNSAPQLTMPVSVGPAESYVYQGGAYGEIEFPSQAQDRQVIDQFLGVSPDTDTMHGAKLPDPSTVSVSVLNGSGAIDQATDTSASLQALGFHMAGIGDAPSVATQSETVVYYSQMTPADEAAAQAVAHSLSGAVIMALGPTSDGARVTVVTGTQFAVNSLVPTPTSPSTTAPTSAGSATGAASATTGFLPPTTSTQALQPWDPRSCTAAGGPGS
ncbi:MAG TPA: LCP family protein [Acidimicrobiales bacterium]|nr:LCP family protein [Acidimicrobiales bacterium]